MGEAIITRRGGGASFAYIAVQYPAGSTLTCTSGAKTLTAENTSGNWTFLVPSAGTWTVRCTDGDRDINKSVSISGKGQTKLVILSYGDLYLSGEEFTDLTGGWTGSGRWSKESDHLYVYAADEGHISGEVHTRNLIDVTDFNTAYIDLYTPGYDGYAGISFYVGSAQIGRVPYDGTSLNISNISGAVQIGVRAGSGYGEAWANISSIRLE